MHVPCRWPSTMSIKLASSYITHVTFDTGWWKLIWKKAPKELCWHVSRAWKLGKGEQHDMRVCVYVCVCVVWWGCMCVAQDHLLKPTHLLTSVTAPSVLEATYYLPAAPATAKPPWVLPSKARDVLWLMVSSLMAPPANIPRVPATTIRIQPISRRFKPTHHNMAKLTSCY